MGWRATSLAAAAGLSGAAAAAGKTPSSSASSAAANLGEQNLTTVMVRPILDPLTSTIYLDTSADRGAWRWVRPILDPITSTIYLDVSKGVMRLLGSGQQVHMMVTAGTSILACGAICDAMIARSQLARQRRLRASSQRERRDKQEQAPSSASTGGGFWDLRLEARGSMLFLGLLGAVGCARCAVRQRHASKATGHLIALRYGERTPLKMNHIVNTVVLPSRNLPRIRTSEAANFGGEAAPRRSLRPIVVPPVRLGSHGEAYTNPQEPNAEVEPDRGMLSGEDSSAADFVRMRSGDSEPEEGWTPRSSIPSPGRRDSRGTRSGGEEAEAEVGGVPGEKPATGAESIFLQGSLGYVRKRASEYERHSKKDRNSSRRSLQTLAAEMGSISRQSSGDRDLLQEGTMDSLDDLNQRTSWFRISTDVEESELAAYANA